MKTRQTFFRLLAFITASWLSLSAWAGHFSLHPDNPRYFLFRGEPTILITSAEHYGAVLNLDFDYKPYFEELAAHGLNNTRTFTGAYVEPKEAFNLARNTLAPAPNRFIAPWARSSTPGYANGGNKFDLTKWDEAYFVRLKDFISQAGKHGIVVELVFFCPFYDDAQWKFSPQNSDNNINGLGKVVRTDVYTMDKHGGLLELHEALARKLVHELRDFDNLYYEVCNEPYFGGVTQAWQNHITDIIVDAQKNHPSKHLISHNVANGAAKVSKPHPAVSLFNFHYASPPDAVALNAHLNKAIGDNETGFRGTHDFPYRKEGWDFILAGGALFNHLDLSFAVGHERGTFEIPAKQPSGGGPAFRRQMRTLKEFIYSFDFLRMKPSPSVVSGGLPDGFGARVLAEAGQAYAIYISPAVQPKNYAPDPNRPPISFALELNLPEGAYSAEWLNPRSGNIERRETIRSTGRVVLNSPEFRNDLALGVKRDVSSSGR
jgi:hypothetical protein